MAVKTRTTKKGIRKSQNDIVISISEGRKAGHNIIVARGATNHWQDALHSPDTCCKCTKKHV